MKVDSNKIKMYTRNPKTTGKGIKHWRRHLIWEYEDLGSWKMSPGMSPTVDRSQHDE